MLNSLLKLENDGASEREVHAITEATSNPFDPEEATPEPLSPTISEADDLFIENILIPLHNHDKLGHEDDKLFMRARLDTGMEDNAISAEKAEESGFEIEPYTGHDLIVGDGKVFRPLGYIELQFHFQRVQAAKTWKVRFLIFPDPPFDVAFGRRFITKAKLIQRPGEALPVEYRKETDRMLAAVPSS